VTALPRIAFRTGLLAWTHFRSADMFRIELASSSWAAPLFLALVGGRIRWTPDRAAAVTFKNQDAAWDAVVAEQLADIVRIRS
jgi:hypothetical protein